MRSPTFEPLHKGHSIEQCAIGLAFDGGLTDESLKAAREAIGDPKDLPGRTEIRGLSIQILQGGPGPSRPTPVTGYSFTRSRADGVVEAELTLQRNVLAFRTMSYSRWANLLKECLPHFEAV